MRHTFLISTFFILFIGISNNTHAQNLVPNGSFEKHYICPFLSAQLEDTIIYNWEWDWGSPDYFCECATNTTNNPNYWVDIPLNFTGFQYARTGSCYAGFAHNALGLLCTDLDENIKTNLSNKLINNQLYNFSCYVSLSDASPYSMDGFDVYLSNDSSLQPYRISPCTFTITPQITHRGKGIIDDTLNWIRISGQFKANGTEDHLFIGTYSALAPSGTKKNSFTPMQFTWDIPAAYYYIDDVALWPSDTIPPQCNAGLDKSICWGDSVRIGTHNYSDYSYQWKAGVNTSFNRNYSSGFIWVSPKYTTTYILETTDFRYEKSYDTVTVVVELCDIKAKEVRICDDDSMMLNPSTNDGFHHLWEPSIFLNSDTLQSPVCKPKTRVAYLHSIINDSGIVIQQDTILVNAMDCSPARNDTTICLGDGVYLGNSNYQFTAYNWHPQDWLDNSLIANPQAFPPKDITYYVSATDTNGVEHKDTVSISVALCNLPPEIIIPNVFTPNGDGINDVFHFQNEEFWNIKTQIFNRWGQLVFEGEGTERWDGTFEGNKASDGVYFYFIEANPLGFDKVLEYHGTISLLK